MNASARRRFPDACLVGGAVDINVTLMRIHLAALVETRFNPLQPQDAGGDFCVGEFGLRGMADDLAGFENRSRPFPCPDFFSNAMQSERRTIRTFGLPDAEA